MSLKLGLMDSKTLVRALLALSMTGALVGCSDSTKQVNGGTGSGGVVQVGDPIDVNGDGKPDGKAVDSDGDGAA